jgi:hypothetical protein
MPGPFYLYPFQIGDVLKLKKPHPCGGQLWEVMRTGADISIKCQTCGRLQSMPRSKLEKAVKSILKHGNQPDGAT